MSVIFSMWAECIVYFWQYCYRLHGAVALLGCGVYKLDNISWTQIASNELPNGMRIRIRNITA